MEIHRNTEQWHPWRTWLTHWIPVLKLLILILGHIATPAQIHISHLEKPLLCAAGASGFWTPSQSLLSFSGIERGTMGTLSAYRKEHKQTHELPLSSVLCWWADVRSHLTMAVLLCCDPALHTGMFMYSGGLNFWSLLEHRLFVNINSFMVKNKILSWPGIYSLTTTGCKLEILCIRAI